MHRAEIAAFLNQKGGVGKTTSVVNIGAGLTILGKKVLIVDLDAQGHLTTFLGIEADEYTNTVYDVLRGRVEPQDAFVKKPLGARFTINGEESQLFMTVMPSNLDLAGADMTLANGPERESLLKKAMNKIRGDFDYILIDCPPSLSLLSTNALVASRKVYIPVQTEYLALESVENLMKTIEAIMERLNPSLQIGGLIATRFDGRKIINRNVVESMKERFGSLLLNTMIRENIVLAESPSYGQDIFTYRPRSNGTEDYMSLCLEIMGAGSSGERPITVERGGIINRRSPDSASPMLETTMS